MSATNADTNKHTAAPVLWEHMGSPVTYDSNPPPVYDDEWSKNVFKAACAATCDAKTIEDAVSLGLYHAVPYCLKWRDVPVELSLDYCARLNKALCHLGRCSSAVSVDVRQDILRRSMSCCSRLAGSLSIPVNRPNAKKRRALRARKEAEDTARAIAKANAPPATWASRGPITNECIEAMRQMADALLLMAPPPASACVALAATSSTTPVDTKAQKEIAAYKAERKRKAEFPAIGKAPGTVAATPTVDVCVGKFPRGSALYMGMTCSCVEVNGEVTNGLKTTVHVWDADKAVWVHQRTFDSLREERQRLAEKAAEEAREKRTALAMMKAKRLADDTDDNFVASVQSKIKDNGVYDPAWCDDFAGVIKKVYGYGDRYHLTPDRCDRARVVYVQALARIPRLAETATRVALSHDEDDVARVHQDAYIMHPMASFGDCIKGLDNYLYRHAHADRTHCKLRVNGLAIIAPGDMFENAKYRDEPRALFFIRTACLRQRDDGPKQKVWYEQAVVDQAGKNYMTEYTPAAGNKVVPGLASWPWSCSQYADVPEVATIKKNRAGLCALRAILNATTKAHLIWAVDVLATLRFTIVAVEDDPRAVEGDDDPF